MNEVEFESLIETIGVNFLITAFAYMIIPIIGFFFEKEKFERKKIIGLVIGNSLVIFFIFLIIHIIQQDNIIPNVRAPFVYGVINYFILASKIKKTDKDKKQEK